MYSIQVNLSDVNVIKKFVFFANQYDFPIILSSGNCIVNGRSIMGIFSLDLAKPIKLECPEGCNDKFISQIKEFSSEK